MQEYFLKTKLISGFGSLSAVEKLQCKKLFVVCDPFFEKNGVLDQLVALSGCGESCCYSAITPDPAVEQVAQGGAQLKAFQPDTLIALGGGSAMDCAKAMLHFSGVKAQFVAIPTTSGSGSEVTDFSVLTHNGVKYPLIDPGICPDMAILDSELLKQLPASLVADTGFDAISHALEAYAATGASCFTDALAEKAFCTAFTSLPRSYGGMLSVRQQLLEASTMAAMAFNRAGLGLCHAMSHALGGQLHLPHGRLNAILLPSIIRFNIPAAQKKYAQLARCAGLPGASDTVAVKNLIQGLIRLRDQLQLPPTLSQAGVSPSAVRQKAQSIIAATLSDPCCGTNPVPADGRAVSAILQEVTGRS